MSQMTQMKQTNVSTFYNTDYVDYGSYDNLRKIGSSIDGLKNSARKIINTVIDKNIRQELKVSQLSSKMAEHTEYLHGDASGVIVTLAQNFPGTNNIPLLDREGNFGTRFSPEASASRYIYTNGSNEMWNLFNKDDENILVKQYFEGDQIEPRFYLPTLPLLLVNGSEGVSSGFAQKILARNPEKIKKHLLNKLNGKRTNIDVWTPYFEGFNGVVEQSNVSDQWIIKGVCTRKSITKVEISELPVGYSLKSYIKVLDKLEENKTITSYKDKSDNHKFLFEVSFLSTNLKALSDDDLLSKLKLLKPVTENYTCIDEDNKIKLFKSPSDIFDYYYQVKLDYLQKRKDYLIEKIDLDIRLDMSKFLFIKHITDGTLKISKRKKEVIEKDLVKIDNIIMKELSFDYLLNMSIQSLTVERMNTLKQQIKDKKTKLDLVKKQTITDMWKEEL